MLKGLLLLLFSGVAFASNSLKSLQNTRYSLFKIRVVSQKSDFQKPWQHRAPTSGSGSGFYIGNGRILTNAHVVANGRVITIQRDGSSELTNAVVEYIAHDSDLAILTVADPKKYFAKIKPLKFGKVPRLYSSVVTVGYPRGGEQLSITKGIVSRISYRNYVHSGYFDHLLIQVDSAINPGNSGGPVFQGEEVIGVAFQAFTSAENTGYIIPLPVVDRFLNDIKVGRYRGHPEMGIQTARFYLNNKETAKYHQLTKPAGVKVIHVHPWSPFLNKIQPNDVLLALDSTPIGVDGLIEYAGERVQYEALFDLKLIGEKVEFTVKRGNSTLKIKEILKERKPHPFDGYSYKKNEPYYIKGGLAFVKLSTSYLRSFGYNWTKKVPSIYKYLYFRSQLDSTLQGRKEFVVISNLLPHRFNRFYSPQIGSIINTVNSIKIDSLAQFAKIMETTKSYVKIGFVGNDIPLILDLDAAKKADKEISSQYQVDPLLYLGPFEDGAVTKGGYNVDS